MATIFAHQSCGGVPDGNFEIFRLGRVLGCQEAILIAEKPNNCKQIHFSETIIGKINEIGRVLVPEALNRPTKMRKAGADSFQILGVTKQRKFRNEIKIFSGFGPVRLRISDNQGSRTAFFEHVNETSHHFCISEFWRRARCLLQWTC